MRRERRVDVSTVRNAECYIDACDFGDGIKSVLTLTGVCEHVRCSNPPVRACIVGGNHPVVDEPNNKGP